MPLRDQMRPYCLAKQLQARSLLDLVHVLKLRLCSILLQIINRYSSCTKNIVMQFHPTIDMFPSPLMSSRSFYEGKVNNLLCSHQHGFRSGHSCLIQLLHYFDDVLENYLSGADTDSIFLDYAKAFEKVDHALLIKKLQRYGIHPHSPSRELDKIISL